MEVRRLEPLSELSLDLLFCTAYIMGMSGLSLLIEST